MIESVKGNFIKENKESLENEYDIDFYKKRFDEIFQTLFLPTSIIMSVTWSTVIFSNRISGLGTTKMWIGWEMIMIVGLIVSVAIWISGKTLYKENKKTTQRYYLSLSILLIVLTMTPAPVVVFTANLTESYFVLIYLVVVALIFGGLSKLADFSPFSIKYG